MGRIPMKRAFTPRFDRSFTEGRQQRFRFASALSLFKASESDRHLFDYRVLADVLRRVAMPEAGVELFKRMAFNALIGNEDDHARNHGIIAGTGGWRLTPVYDLVPIPTTSQDVRLAMTIGDVGRNATLQNLASCAPRFGLSCDDGAKLVETMASAVDANWEDCLRNRGVPTDERRHLSGAFVKKGIGIDLPSANQRALARRSPSTGQPSHPEGDRADEAGPDEDHQVEPRRNHPISRPSS